MEKLYIAGFGLGHKELLTEKTKKIIQSSSRVLSTSRIGQSGENIKSCTLSELMAELDKPVEGDSVVLVSGDCSFFSIAKNIVRDFSDRYEIELVNGISSIQYFSAKIAVPYDDSTVISMHGRNAQIIPKVAYNKKVFALTGGTYKAHDICRILCNSGLHHVKVKIGEKLSYSDERIVCGLASDLKDEIFDDLSVMYVENSSAENPHLPIRDDEFVRGDIPMTKEEIRWLSLQKLSILPTDIIYDIGAGTGSVSVEMARKAFDGFVYSVEMKADACELIEKNKVKHGAYNVQVVCAKAPEQIHSLPTPNKVFIGGSAGNMDNILGFLVEKNRNIKIVANAISLQSLNQILVGFERYGIKIKDNICVNIAKSKKLGSYDIMMAQNPVYIVAGECYE